MAKAIGIARPIEMVTKKFGQTEVGTMICKAISRFLSARSAPRGRLADHFMKHCYHGLRKISSLLGPSLLEIEAFNPEEIEFSHFPAEIPNLYRNRNCYLIVNNPVF